MQFSKYVGSFVYHCLVGSEVYKVTTPREGQSQRGSDGVEFTFHVQSKSVDSTVSIKVSRTQLATRMEDSDFELVISRATLRSLAEDTDTFQLTTSNFGDFKRDLFKDKPDHELRQLIARYIHTRYEILFEAPFTVFEVSTAIQSPLDRVIRALHYLHKHEFVGFSWSPSSWKTLGCDSEWLGQEFALTNDNLINLNNSTLLRSSAGAQIADHGGRAPELTSLPRSEVNSYDFFICHASEDKGEVVEPLALELSRRNLRIWYDDWVLTLGDSLSRRIDDGLRSSRYGIVVVSPAFFRRDWPQRELGGLVQKEIGGEKVIIPVWHNVDRHFVSSYSPTLADKLAGNTTEGISSLCEKIISATSIDRSGLHTSAQPSRTGAAEVSIGFDQIQIQSHVHLYRLWIRAKLLVPPTQGSLRLKFLWPMDVPIVRIEGIEHGERVSIDGIEFGTMEVNWSKRIYPGETRELVGLNSGHILEYKFNDSTWRAVQKAPRSLTFELFLEDHSPVDGQKLFSELHVF